MVVQQISNFPENEAKKLFLGKTIEVWQPHASGELTQEDARQMIENAVGLFRILQEWEKKEGDAIYS